MGWWKFNDCQGAAAVDASGNGNTGTITAGDDTGNNDSVGTCNSGAANPANEMWNVGTNGKFNSSLGFDGTNDYVTVSANTLLNSLTAGMTVSLWINPTSIPSAYKRFISRGSDPAQQWEVEFDGANPGKVYYDSGVAASRSNTVLSAGNWYHLVMTRDPSANLTSLYINGRLDSSVSGSASSGESADIAIGADVDGTDLFTGLIDDVRIYNYALTSTQVKTLYNNGAVNFAPITGSP